MRVLLYTPCYTIDRDGQSLRITKLTNALASRGWHFDIITTPVFFLGNQSLCMELQDIHYTVRHLHVFLTDPAPVATLRHRLHRKWGLRGKLDAQQERNEPHDLERTSFSRRILRRVNGGYNHVFARIGDPDWIVPAILQGFRLLRQRSYQLVFASASSYFASHIAAATVSAMSQLPLVLDYGDPWNPEPPRPTKWLDRLSETSVLKRAGKVVVTNGRFREALLASYPFLRPSQISVVSQGYPDEAPVEGPSVTDRNTLQIVYTGVFYRWLRSPTQFLEALRAVRSHGMRVKFLRAGPPLSPDEVDQIRQLGLASSIEDLGELSHEDALALQRRATILLVIGNRSRYQIPGKVLEYIGARRPILCLSQGPDDLAAAFVKERGLGIVAPNHADSIAKVLTELHDLWLKGQLETIYHPTDIEAYSWRSLARELESAFLDVIARNVPNYQDPGRRDEDKEREEILLQGASKT